MKKMSVVAAAACLAFGCAGADGAVGPQGIAGADGAPCTVADQDGAKIITCADGTSVTVPEGQPGQACSVVEIEPGVKEITCADGTTARVHDGAAGSDATGCLMTDHGDGTATIDCPGSDPVMVVVAAVPEQPTELVGSLTVENVHDLGLLQGYSSLTGDLTIAPGLTHIILPNLVDVGGAISMTETGLVSFVADNLVSVGGEISADTNTKLETFSTPALKSAGSIKLKDNFALSTLTLTALETVGDELWMQKSTVLTALDVPNLTTIPGDLWIEHNAGLESFSMPKLTSMNRFWLEHNYALLSFDLSGLEADIDECMVSSNFYLAECMIDQQVTSLCKEIEKETLAETCKCDESDVTQAVCD